MTALDELKELCNQYEAVALAVRAKASAFAGVFGLGDDPRKNACHDQFFDAVEQWVKTFAASGPSREEAGQVVRFLVEAAHLNRNKETFWYLFAVQGHARRLVPMLDPRQAAELVRFYDQVYPKSDRMPVQQELYKLLKQHAGENVSSESFFRKIFRK